jgi:hypothetical protein
VRAVAGNSSDDARRPEGLGVTSARLVSGYRGHLPCDGQKVTTGHGNAMEVPGHVAQGQKTAVTDELIQSDRGNLYGGRTYQRRRYLRDPERYPSTSEHESPHWQESGREGRRRRGDEPKILLQLLYHGIPLQLT